VNGTVHLQRAGESALVVLDSPGRLNAISESMWQSLARIFEGIAAAPEPRAVVVRGAGRNFAAGADIDEFERVRGDPASGRRYHLETIANALAAISGCPVPVIAATIPAFTLRSRRPVPTVATVLPSRAWRRRPWSLPPSA
jgi:enoyl-CoA hydratase/carnithine racemase